ncbi:TetR family transcriptional regulator [Mycolicibacterium sarraceniae]|uniref:TetR family transcriptional regulator n=1 Tax=Mycolicibacterium sarraceniae TaxID=1534348 RepID=A0A7I7SPQ6_9MYCO|nr:TetR family transcriptional regulator [Mycolicibacterium sarraceniae]
MLERRRGVALEYALLDAACAELSEKGYANFTMDAVAVRAGTSTPVLYRRWSNKRDLARAAVGHTARNSELELPDTGSLRGDVLALMRQSNQPGARLITMISVHLGGYFQETGTSPAELVGQLAPELPLLGAVDTIYDRAFDRGEIDPERITNRMKTLPFDLLRAQLLMTLQPAPDPDLEEIVDTLLLPLVRAQNSR